MSGGWNTIESDAGVFTFLLDNLGVKDVQFEELISLDVDTIRALAPVYGVIFLFRYPTGQGSGGGAGGGERGEEKVPLDGQFDHEAATDLFFAAQTIQNACGTQALLSVLLNHDNPAGAAAEASAGEENGTSGIEIGSALRDFKDFTISLPAEFRGEALSNSELIRDVHNSFAKSSPFADETQRDHTATDADDVYHFIAYTAIRGQLYELDGLQPAPISHGACASLAEFPDKVIPVLQRRIERYPSGEIRFNLLAMCRDLRLRAREWGDEETLLREENKRAGWMFENALRRHNFVGFAGEVLKAVMEAKVQEGGGAYERWIEEAKKKTVERSEGRKNFRAERDQGGDGDVEMG